MIKRTTSARWFPLLIAVFWIAGCGGLPKESVQEAKMVPERAQSLQKQIEEKKTEFEKLKKSSEWSFLEPYAKREKWVDSFTRAQRSVAQALTVYESEVTPILKKNKADLTAALRQQMKRVNSSLKEARENVEAPKKRGTFLLNARKQAPKWVARARMESEEAGVILKIAVAKGEKAQVDYAQKKVDIDKRLAGLRKTTQDAESSYAVAKSELENVAFGTADYAKLGDATVRVSDELRSLKSESAVFERKMGELYKSYSKTLVDMKVDYYVTIARTSWDEYWDFPTEHEVTWTKPVDEETFEYFDALPDGAIAVSNSRNLRLLIPEVNWKALKIDNPLEQWTSGDDASEFWVKDMVAKTYHKYAVVENGIKKETGWESVSEDVFWANVDNLGMTIVSKPYGKYESEVIKSAVPPGMEYIAKPKMVNGQPVGSNQYGEWRRDSSGASFWHFYGQYAFMRDLLFTPSYRYGYDDWNDYDRRRGGGAYYGRSKQFGTNGSLTRKATRYRSSDFAKRNPGTFSGKRASASVRGAGGVTRGRGPGGSGK